MQNADPEDLARLREESKATEEKNKTEKSSEEEVREPEERSIEALSEDPAFREWSLNALRAWGEIDNVEANRRMLSAALHFQETGELPAPEMLELMPPEEREQFVKEMLEGARIVSGEEGERAAEQEKPQAAAKIVEQETEEKVESGAEVPTTEAPAKEAPVAEQEPEREAAPEEDLDIILGRILDEAKRTSRASEIGEKRREKVQQFLQKLDKLFAPEVLATSVALASSDAAVKGGKHLTALGLRPAQAVDVVTERVVRFGNEVRLGLQRGGIEGKIKAYEEDILTQSEEEIQAEAKKHVIKPEAYREQLQREYDALIAARKKVSKGIAEAGRKSKDKALLTKAIDEFLTLKLPGKRHKKNG